MAVNYDTLKEIIVNWASTDIDTTPLWVEYDDGVRSWNYRGNTAFFDTTSIGSYRMKKEILRRTVMLGL